MLQYVAVCCSVLQLVAVDVSEPSIYEVSSILTRIVLVAVCCSLRDVCCSMLQCVAVRGMFPAL